MSIELTEEIKRVGSLFDVAAGAAATAGEARKLLMDLMADGQHVRALNKAIQGRRKLVKRDLAELGRVVYRSKPYDIDAFVGYSLSIGLDPADIHQELTILGKGIPETDPAAVRVLFWQAVYQAAMNKAKL